MMNRISVPKGTEQPSPGASVDDSPRQGESKVTFTAYPIETAPKHRPIMLFVANRWERGEWSKRGKKWMFRQATQSFQGYTEMVDGPTHWAEIEAMRP